MKQQLQRIGQIEARLPFDAARWLDNGGTDDSELTAEQNDAIIAELDRRIIAEFGEEGERELQRLRDLTDEELEAEIAADQRKEGAR